MIMKHLAAIAAAGLLVGAGLIAAALTDNKKKKSTDTPILLKREWVIEYSDGIPEREYEIIYEYDENGILKGFSSPDGVVKTLTKDNSDDTESVRSFNDSGNVISLHVYNKGDRENAISSVLYSYDEEGRLGEEKHFDAAGEHINTVKYTYTEEGRINDKRILKPDGAEISNEQHFYDEFGLETEQLLYIEGMLQKQNIFEYE